MTDKMPSATYDEMIKVPLLDLCAQYAGLREEIRASIDEVCDAQAFILGPKVDAFERHVARYCGTSCAVGMSSGTDALLAALMALGVGPGDGVVTTAFSFFATAGCIVRLGAIPVFADIDPVTFNLSAASVRHQLQKAHQRFPGIRIKALMPVHLYGQVADMDALLAIATDYKLHVVEDACQAIGAEYPSSQGVKKAGAIGDVGCFSFFPSKNLGGFGDGGMAVTHQEAHATCLRQLRNHGMEPKYYHPMVGGNFRLDALQAAVLDVKLRYLNQWHEARRQHAAYYDQCFNNTTIVTPQCVYAPRNLEHPHVYNQYVVRVAERDRVRASLMQANVGHDVYYPVPLHLQACFKDLGYTQGDFPECERAAAEVLALPVYPELTMKQQDHVVETLLTATGNAQ